MAREERSVEAAMVIPVELITTAAGTDLAVDIIATSPDAADMAIRDFAEETGAEAVVDETHCDNGRRARGKSTFFSSSRWNSGWEPKGPTPPWAQKPENNYPPPHVEKIWKRNFFKSFS